MLVLWQKRLYSDKVVVIGQSGGIRAKVVVFGQKWLYSGRSGCIWVKLLSSAKVVVFGKSECIQAK